MGVLIFVLFYHRNRSSLFNFDYAGVSKALEKADDVIGNTYDNLVLPEELDIPDVDTLYTFETDMSVYHDEKAKKKAAELAEAFFGIDAADANVERREPYDVPGYCVLSDEESMVSISSSVYGLSYVTLEHYRSGEQKIIAEYDLKKDDISNVSYTIGGEEYKAEDAVKFAESFINEKIIPIIEYSDSCRPVKLFVTEEPDGRNTYLLYFSHIVDGVEVEFTEGSMCLPDIDSMRASTMILAMYEKESIDYFWNTTYFNMDGEKKEVKRIITLESALEYLEELLAEYSSYTINEVTLRYAAYRDDPYEDIISFRPYWTFNVQNRSAIGKIPGDLNTVNSTIIYVDAIDGSTYCLDYAENDMLFINVEEE